MDTYNAIVYGAHTYGAYPERCVRQQVIVTRVRCEHLYQPSPAARVL